MDRLQIAFFGATNSGKSTLVNALAGQEVSLVSELPGTTTDPVRKRAHWAPSVNAAAAPPSMPPISPCSSAPAIPKTTAGSSC